MNPTSIIYPSTEGSDPLTVPKFKRRKDIVPLDSDDSDDEDAQDGDTAMDSSPEIPLLAEELGRAEAESQNSSSDTEAAEGRLAHHVPRFAPWTIKSKGWSQAASFKADMDNGTSVDGASGAKKDSKHRKRVDMGRSPRDGAFIRSSAFSPGGAEWLVTVGEWTSIALHHLVPLEEGPFGPRCRPGYRLELVPA